MVIHMVEVKCRVLRIVLASDINTSVQWSESLEIRMQHVTGISCRDSHDFHSIVWHPFDLQYDVIPWNSMLRESILHQCQGKTKIPTSYPFSETRTPCKSGRGPNSVLIKETPFERLLPPLVTRVLLSCEKQRQDVSLPCVWAPYCCIEDRTCVESEQMNPW